MWSFKQVLLSGLCRGIFTVWSHFWPHREGVSQHPWKVKPWPYQCAHHEMHLPAWNSLTPRNLQVPGLSRFPVQECCKVLTVEYLNSTLKNHSNWQGWEKPWKPSHNSIRNYGFVFLVLKQIQWQRRLNASSMFIRIHLFSANSLNSRKSPSPLP